MSGRCHSDSTPIERFVIFKVMCFIQKRQLIMNEWNRLLLMSQQQFREGCLHKTSSRKPFLYLQCNTRGRLWRESEAMLTAVNSTWPTWPLRRSDRCLIVFKSEHPGGRIVLWSLDDISNSVYKCSAPLGTSLMAGKLLQLTREWQIQSRMKCTELEGGNF